MIATRITIRANNKGQKANLHPRFSGKAEDEFFWAIYGLKDDLSGSLANCKRVSPDSFD
jgi:hypothetical protein